MLEARAVIFTNGNLPDIDAARSLLQTEDTLIAADGGMRHILDLGLLPSVVIGDLDSLSENVLNSLTEAGVRIVRYPVDKDFTDLELAFDYAVNAGYRSILVVAALGSRLDQTIGNLALLTRSDLLELDVRLDDGIEEAFFIRKEGVIQGQAGDIVSLVPWSGPVKGVATDGLHWSLQDETLYAHTTRGISNEMVGDRATVRLESGLLLCIHRRHTP